MKRSLLLVSAAVGAAMLPLGAVQAADQLRPAAFDWSGFYAGVHAGQLNGDVNVHEEGGGGGAISGTVWGLLAGYNFRHSPLDPWLLGVEADIGFANVHGQGVIQICVDSSPDYLYDLNWDAHLRVRAGAPQGNMMPFVAAGLALADLNITEGCGGLDFGGLYTGGTVGAGVDFRLSPQAMIRGEFLYDFYLDKRYTDFSANFTAWTGRVAFVWRLP